MHTTIERVLYPMSVLHASFFLLRAAFVPTLRTAKAQHKLPVYSLAETFPHLNPVDKVSDRRRRVVQLLEVTLAVWNRLVLEVGGPVVVRARGGPAVAAAASPRVPFSGTLASGGNFVDLRVGDGGNGSSGGSGVEVGGSGGGIGGDGGGSGGGSGVDGGGGRGGGGGCGRGGGGGGVGGDGGSGVGSGGGGGVRGDVRSGGGVGNGVGVGVGVGFGGGRSSGGDGGGGSKGRDCAAGGYARLEGERARCVLGVGGGAAYARKARGGAW